MAMTADPQTNSNVADFSDAEVIALIASGETRALEVLYDRYSRVVYSFAVRIVSDPQLAEEVLQEVFFRVWQQGGCVPIVTRIVDHLAAQHHAQPGDRRSAQTPPPAAEGG